MRKGPNLPAGKQAKGILFIFLPLPLRSNCSWQWRLKSHPGSTY